jgi:hypothetical protein
MRKVLILLIWLLFVWQSYACYTSNGYWIADHISYIYELDDTYWTELSRYYRMQSAYILNAIRNNNISSSYNNDIVYQLSVWNKFKSVVDIILDSNDLNEDSRWILIFLKSRIQNKVDSLLETPEDKMCSTEDVLKCLLWPEKENCKSHIFE